MSQFSPTHAFSVSSGANPVAFNPQPYGNTTTILVYNDSDTDVFLRWQDDTTEIDIDNGTQVPTKGSVSLTIGPASERPSPGATELKLDCASGSKKVNVTYVNGAIF